MKQALAAFIVPVLLGTMALAQQPRELKPGWNLFSKEQDVQLGKEAAAEIEKQVRVVNDAQLNSYVRRIGERLASTPEAGGFPYSFKVVGDQSLNAFALPGGPTYVHTGLIAAAENEAQLAGVMAHEISHVALRHGTNQASKANLVQLPAVLAGAVLGQNGGMLGSLAQLGIGLGANSVLMKFSRSAERDADLLGARIMAKAGYNPIEMARFFEKLEAEGGSRGPQFLSSHPNPGNRMKAVEDEIRMMPARNYTTNSGEFAQMRQRAGAIKVPQTASRAQASGGSSSQSVPAISVSGRFRQHRGTSYTVSYPDNWQVISGQQQSGNVTIAPREGVVEASSGAAIGVGAVIGLHPGQGDLRRDTDNLVQQLASTNAGMKAVSSQSGRVDGQPAMLVTLNSQSPWAGETEVDTLVTVERPDGLFYMVLIAPRSAQSNVQGAFNNMIRSIRFAK
ncbi:MAG TPA: M48 family metalloprotease [Bryobacteraceae bacterium]|nr:M48 family metalloprotease [Bryobacteraceae bacterium]